MMKYIVLFFYVQSRILGSGLVETLEFVNNYCVSEIAQKMSLLDSQKDWENFVNESLPKASVYVARRGRIAGAFGRGTGDWLKEGFEKQFLFGIHQGGQVFENQAATFFSRQVLWGDFLATEGRMQAVYTRRVRAAYLWIRLDQITVFVLFKADDLPPISWWKVHYQEHLPKDEGDFETGIWAHYLGAVILFTILFPTLFWIRVRIRFCLRFGVSLLLLLILSLILVSLFTESLIQEKAQTIKNEYMAEKQRQIFEMEAGYLDFLNEYAKNLSQDFQKIGPPASILEGGYFAVGNTQGLVLESNPVPSVQLSALFCKMYPYFIYKNKPDETLLKKLESCRDQSAIVKVTTDRGMGSMVRGLASGSEERFRVSNLQGSGLAIWHKTLMEGQEPTVIMVVHSSSDLQRIYWEKVLDEGRLNLLAIADLTSAVLYQKDKNHSLSTRTLLKDPGSNSSLVLHKNGYLYQSRGTQYSRTVFSFFIDKGVLFAPLKAMYQNYLLVVFLMFLFGISGFLLFVKGFQVKLKQLIELLQKAVRQEPVVFSSQAGQDELSRLTQDLEVMLSELELAKNAMPFVATDILELFTDSAGRLMDQVEDKACVLFSDIRSFTSISETYAAEEIVEMLNEYFTLWEAEVRKRGGVIEKFIGDAVVVLFFGCKDKNYIQNAVETALSMRQKVDEFNSLRQSKGLFIIRNGMGIATSTMKFSVIGNQKKRHFYSDSSALSEAEELEAMTKFGKYTQIYASEPVVYALASAYDWHPVEDKAGVYELE